MGESRSDDLQRRARELDPQALAEVVSVYGARVFGLAYRLTGSADVAEDLVQETFLRVVQSIGRYDDRGRFEAWLFRIAANVARDHARRSARRGPTAGLDAGAGGRTDESDPADPRAADPLENAARREASERLAAGLARLSAPDREVLALRHYSGLPFREVASILGVPLGTALARAHRALEHLRKAMEGAGGAIAEIGEIGGDECGDPSRGAEGSPPAPATGARSP